MTDLNAWTPESLPDTDADAAGRERMVATIRAHGCRHERVLAAMLRLPRRPFIPELRPGDDPHGDLPLPIGHGATISQPFIVAYMTALLDPQPTDRVLEIGTGSGYQAALLALLAGEVYSVEREPALALWARERRDALGLHNLHLRHADGRAGWPEAAPFDGILLTCSPRQMPAALLRQLRDGGRLVAPVGGSIQTLQVVERHGDRLDVRDDLAVRFVPMR